MHSYKAPRKKPLFSKDTLLWGIFVSVIFAALVAFGSYLFFKSSGFKSELEKLEDSNKILSKSVISYEKEMKILKMQKLLSQEVKSSNLLLKNSIKNLFDLVPDQIVLTKVVMRKDLLDLEGTSPTKDTYRLLLEPPLKSIFNNSKVSYVFNSRLGQYEFKSINSMVAQTEEANNGEKE